MRKALEAERKQRQAKEGEATQLRSNAQRTAKDQEAKLLKEQALNADLQDKVAKLERAAREDKARHQSEVLFARQEHESAVRQRNNASQRPSAKKRVPSASKASPQRPKMPEKKGFQNSFAESTSRKDESALGPRLSPTDARTDVRCRSSAATPAQLANGDDKGKERASDIDMDLSTDVDSGFMLDGNGDATLLEEAFIATSIKDAIVSYLFDHPVSLFDNPLRSIHALLNAKMKQGCSADVIEAHNKASQALFACLSRIPSTSLADTELQDRIFLSNILLAITSFAEFFASQQMSDEALLSLGLLRDLLYTFKGLLSHEDVTLPEYFKAIKAIFQLVIRLIPAHHSRYLDFLQKRKQAQNRSATQSGIVRQSVKDALTPLQPQVWQAKEVDPIFHAVLGILAVLAWQPDSTCLAKYFKVFQHNLEHVAD